MSVRVPMYACGIGLPRFIPCPETGKRDEEVEGGLLKSIGLVVFVGCSGEGDILRGLLGRNV